MGEFRTTWLGMACGVALLMAPGVALAHSIDGSWCHKDGKQLSVDGPRIVTPGGNMTTGDYDRQGTSYIVPPGERGAGKSMVMSLVDEDTMQMSEGTLRVISEIASTWQRCPVPMS
jgi:hypothetical protein